MQSMLSSTDLWPLSLTNVHLLFVGTLGTGKERKEETERKREERTFEEGGEAFN